MSKEKTIELGAEEGLALAIIAQKLSDDLAKHLGARVGFCLVLYERAADDSGCHGLAVISDEKKARIPQVLDLAKASFKKDNGVSPFGPVLLFPSKN